MQCPLLAETCTLGFPERQLSIYSLSELSSWRCLRLAEEDAQRREAEELARQQQEQELKQRQETAKRRAAEIAERIQKVLPSFASRRHCLLVVSSSSELSWLDSPQRGNSLPGAQQEEAEHKQLLVVCARH
eukprot:scaffold2162_cov398-Prasinococcus_capsulatus_cf.AAC.2